MASREQQFDSNIAFFIPVAVASPGVSADRETLKSLLEPLDLKEVLFITARLNLIVSDKVNDDSREVHWSLRLQKLQSELVLNFFNEEQVSRISSYLKARKAGPGSWQAFFRGQLLELVRQACVFCSERPDAIRIETDSMQRARFAEAALIASDLWSERVYQGRFTGPEDLEDKRLNMLGPFRRSHTETSFGPDLPTAFVRGKRLICELLTDECRDFEDLFRSKTNLSLDEYYTWLLVFLTQSLGFTSAPGTPRVQVMRELNIHFCDEVPNLREGFRRFIDCESQTVAELKAALGNEDEPYDLNVIRRRPILVASDGRAMTIDPVFLAEKACVGPLFRVGLNRGFDAFGMAVERYGQELLRNMYPLGSAGLLYDRLKCPLEGRNENGRGVQLADAFLGGGLECVFFEIKGKWLREDVLARAPEDYQKHIREKYSGNVGVGQLARNISKLAKEEWRAEGDELSGVKCVFPVMVVYDDRLDAPLHVRFLAHEFARCLYGDDTLGYIRIGKWVIAPLTVMTVDNLEALEASVHQFGLCELLRDYSRECVDRFVSLHNFIVSSPKYSRSLFESGRVRATFSAELRALEERLSAPPD
ncbi:MAG: hypothetical protein WCD12_09020 [Candidatus Binatus sp.]|jgi:hypothetical protein|uniref:hypothetical protein n=1 Tax=Candidatus Binatus sp. TaxID=2811406 RepID=UPI003C76750B